MTGVERVPYLSISSTRGHKLGLSMPPGPLSFTASSRRSLYPALSTRRDVLTPRKVSMLVKSNSYAATYSQKLALLLPLVAVVRRVSFSAFRRLTPHRQRYQRRHSRGHPSEIQQLISIEIS